jgi:hypothetical protein
MMTKSFARRLGALGRAVVLASACALWPGTALAQEFQKVDGPLRPELPAGPFVGAAYGFIWIAILVYVLFVARGLARVRRDLVELRRELDRKIDGGGAAGPRP